MKLQIVSLTLETQLGDRTKHLETVQQIADYMDRWLDAHRQYHWNIIVRIRQRVRNHNNHHHNHNHNNSAISTFSPVGSLSSNGLRMRVCVCLCGILRNELICVDMQT